MKVSFRADGTSAKVEKPAKPSMTILMLMQPYQPLAFNNFQASFPIDVEMWLEIHICEDMRGQTVEVLFRVKSNRMNYDYYDGFEE